MKMFNYPKDKEKILKNWASVEVRDLKLEEYVFDIINKVRKNGDKALCDFSYKFDGVKIDKNKLRIPESFFKKAWDNASDEFKASIKAAHKNISQFHHKQKLESWQIKRPDGSILSQRVGALNRVGVYVPGGRAPYPSTLLMNVIPAQTAGVKDIVLVTPPQKEAGFSDSVFAAAHFLGIKEAYWAGGAQSVAALAYGTESIKKVDKVVGPGNKFVATAKRLLYGEIDIDSVAGPSEIMVIADKSATIEFIAADMLSQAEHDEDAKSIAILIEPFATDYLIFEIERQAKLQPRYQVIKKSLKNNGIVVKVKSREAAAEIANLLAPEHLEVMTEKPGALAKEIPNVGAIFIGEMTPEPIGDYIAGSNHVLPTSGTARFFSPLSVYDFLKISNCIEYTEKAMLKDGEAAVNIAETEGFFAHAESVKKRLEVIRKRSKKK